MRKYKIYMFSGPDCVEIIESTNRDAKKTLEEFNKERRKKGMKEADRCIVYTASMSRLADVRVVKREGQPDAYVYYPI